MSKVAALAALARVDKPTGTLLLLWPGTFSIAMAAAPGALPDLSLLGLFTVGAFVMRGAGCTVNDLWDKDFDRRVERTRGRPLAAGHVSESEAVAFLGAQLAAGLGVLTQLNMASIALGAMSVPLVLAYPLAKRFTRFPQAVLGLTFNWGAMLGYCAAAGHVDWGVCAPLYLGCVSWTMVYDTLYGHQDKRDDRKLGLNSTAITFGDAHTKPVLSAFAAASVGLIGLAGHNAGIPLAAEGLPFYASLAGFAAHQAWQLRTAQLDDPANLWTRFKSNGEIAPLLLGGIVASKLLL